MRGQGFGLFKSWPQHSTLRLNCHKRSQKRDLQREKLHGLLLLVLNPQESSYPSLAPWVFRSRFLACKRSSSLALTVTIEQVLRATMLEFVSM